MYAYTILTTCLVLLSSVSVQAAAVAPRFNPDATAARLAARAVISGGSTCYFTCPADYQTSGGQTASLSSSVASGTSRDCTYTDTNQQTTTCTYNSDGTLAGNSAADCPPEATDAGCTTTGTGTTVPGAFRRSTRRVRVLTRAEKIIRARQYRPKKVVRSQK